MNWRTHYHSFEKQEEKDPLLDVLDMLKQESEAVEYFDANIYSLPVEFTDIYFGASEVISERNPEFEDESFTDIDTVNMFIVNGKTAYTAFASKGIFLLEEDGAVSDRYLSIESSADYTVP